MRDDTDPILTPVMLLQGYRAGVFPMSESRDDPTVFWVNPRRRGVFPLDSFHVSRSFSKTLRKGHFSVTADTAFSRVLMGCADRTETWINNTIYDLYLDLHGMGVAHSVEVWEDGVLAGGVYGVALGAAFFGESMFSVRTDASKVALLYAIDRLREQKFTLFDTQFITPHLESLGAIEISRSAYHSQLEPALQSHATFGPSGPMLPTDQRAQLRTQTS